MGLEDRIHAAGHGDAFIAACEEFIASRKTREQQYDFYDKLCNWGASPEEADEFTNLMMES